ncbi:MAG: murein L,D-transpeptidase catalytic domain family protein [Pseudomonadota bacterium]
MLRLGAMGAAGALISSSGASQGLNLLAPQQPLGANAIPQSPFAQRPVLTAPAGIDPELFGRAKAALDQHRIYARDTIGIVDFSKPSAEPRFHLVDLASGQVESFRVAHGRGSDPNHDGFVERFSNDFGSLATSNGTYVTSDYYNGKYGLSMKVRGLDWSNFNAESRAIVIHNAWYAEDDMIALHGKLGRSEGCFSMSRENQHKVMRKLAGGRMIYADKLA